MLSERPEGWAAQPLSDVAKIAMGETLLSKSLTGSGVPVFSANTDSEPWGYTDQNRRTLKRGAIVVGARGSIGFPRLPPFEAFTSTQTTITIEPDSTVVDSTFLHAVLCAADIRSLAAQQAVPMLTIGMLAPLPILLPPLDEQRRIAEVLRAVDEAIRLASATAERSLRCLEVALATLTGGDVNEEGWTEGRCDNFFVLQRGFDITEGQATPGPYQVFSSSGPSYTHSEARVDAPAVITGRKGRLGTVFYSEHPCWPHDTTLWVKDYKGNHPRFVFWKMRSMNLGALDAATSVPTLNRNNVHALHVRFPSLRRQVEISEILDAQERALSDQRAQVRVLNTAKAKLASDLLTGRVRVPV